MTVRLARGVSLGDVRIWHEADVQQHLWECPLREAEADMRAPAAPYPVMDANQTCNVSRGRRCSQITTAALAQRAQSYAHRIVFRMSHISRAQQQPVLPH